MFATRENMRKCAERNLDFCAYDTITGATYSANPNDYFWLPDGVSLMGEADYPCILVVRTPERYEPIEDF